MAELLFPLIGEAVLLTLETLEMTVDTVFETLVGLTAEQSQRATAWTGFAVFLGLLLWGGFAIRKRYLRAKANAPRWWAAKKAEMRQEWAEMSWKEKLGYAGGTVAMLGLLVLFI